MEEMLEFKVISVTSTLNDESFEDDSLLKNRPWISERSCSYPQQIMLRIAKKAAVSRIKILCHNDFITNSINLYASKQSDQDQWEDVDFIFLGAVKFREANVEGRNELKTILTDMTMFYIKLELEQNYFDRRRNPYNQVAIVSIELFGQYIADESTTFGDETSVRGASAQSTEIDDFSRSYVPRLFTPMNMRVTGSSLEKNDFENPSRSRSQSLDGGVLPGPSRVKMTPTIRPASGKFEERISEKRYSPAPISKQRRNKMVKKTSNKFLEKENTIVPAALTRNGRGRSPVQISTEKDSLLNAINPGDRADASKAIALYGVGPIRDTYSKKWKERVNGFNEIIVILQETKAENISSHVEFVLPMLCNGLKDNLFMVYSTALVLLKFIALELIPDRKIRKAICSALAGRTLDILISKMGDTDKRVNDSTFEAVMTILHSDPKVVKPFIIRILLPLKASGSFRSDFGKAELVWNAVTQLQAPNNQIGLTEKAVNIFSVSCLEHSSPKVRDLGKALLIYAYKKFDNREAVRAALSAVNRTSTENDFLLRAVRDQFDAIDDEITAFSRSGQISRDSQGTNARSEYSFSNISKQSSKKQPKSVRLVAHNNKNRPESYDYDKICMYCGAKSEDFNKEGLDMHYLNECYMLTECNSCNKIIEISTMKEHLLKNCAARDQYVNCPICDEPILRRNYNRHLAAKQCKEMTDASAGRCLLCHEDIKPNNDIGWRKHLRNRCSGNKRII